MGIPDPMDGGRGVRTGCMRIKFQSPRRIMSRWFSSQGKVKVKKTTDTVVIRNSFDDGLRVGEYPESPQHTIHSELQRSEFLFSIGVSCYLLQLISTGREEIHKIVELRKDVEKFLEYHNDELRRNQQEFIELRNDIEKFLEYHNDELRRKQQEQCETSAYSTTSYVVDGPESSTDHYYSPEIQETSLYSGGEGSSKQYVHKVERDCGGEMDQLEAELEAEFELLQFVQDHEVEHSNLKQISHRSEVSEGLTLGKICPRPEEKQQGVCPYELERRLHEVLETRQEEEIKELEIALEDAKHILLLKESEAARWKDTAYIVSERIPEPSSITSSSRTHRYTLSS